MRLIAAVLVLAFLTATPLRTVLESGMRLHMLALYPLLMLAGTLLAQALPRPLARALSKWNTLGLSGLGSTVVFVSVLMIPRVLDQGLVDARMEAMKIAMLLFVGAAIGPSWRAAGPVVQTFFLGSLLPMMVVVGSLYRDSPLRLCNAYRLDEQQRLGTELIYIAVAGAGCWLVRSVVGGVLRQGRTAAPRVSGGK